MCVATGIEARVARRSIDGDHGGLVVDYRCMFGEEIRHERRESSST